MFDNLQPDEIAELIRKGPLLDAAVRLVELTAERMNSPVADHPSKPDDATFILFRLTSR